MVVKLTTRYASGQFSVTNGMFDIMMCSAIAKLGHTRACAAATRGCCDHVYDTLNKAHAE